ncbi:TIGR01212 family radical SAM protein [Acidaminobacter sp. JC074]|uniref:TIGR01212 family radical SAM protein n=1 Tax=Acidaminobacter sp. JC074 TaxID=2530199 RepID=UPI001F0E9914|nr:TIGR01212 family radical SAM protein [Acidaminobacter sp. JC074]MCH4891102.1 TIGR01212 family radical SAM protein [Acidaminobacter sp. JC074]
MDRYKKYSTYLKDMYGEKVYKIPVNLPLTCPNRDGQVADGGCTFCGDVATGFESLENTIDVKSQLVMNIERMMKRYKAKKYIAYFQNFTNTYMPLDEFKTAVEEACIEDVVEICISSRPDCIHDAYLDILDEISKTYGVNISVELGLQSMKHDTLEKINRGHSLAEFIDAVRRIKSYDFKVGVHLILNLPWDDKSDIIETAKVMAALDIDLIKIHSLYILRNTIMGQQFESEEFTVESVDAYVDKVVEFIRYTQPKVAFQRLLGRAPKEETLFCNWDMSWWKIHDMIEERLETLDASQGDKCDYLGGKAVKKFV